MASTAGGLATRQLRNLLSTSRNVVYCTPSCSYTTRTFTTSRKLRSSWPASASDVDTEVLASSSSSTQIRLDSIPTPPRAKTIADLLALKSSNTPIACLTAYDFPTALSIRSAPIDLCLIGDSLANVALGYSTTQGLSLDAMIHHCLAVKRGLDSPLFSVEGSGVVPQPPLVIADLPFGVAFGSVDEGVKAVVKLMQETGVDGVKIEGAQEVIPLITRLTSHGVPVMGHLGLQPQRVGSTSGYRVQGKTAAAAKEIMDSARLLQSAGCFSIVLECIPTRIGEYISKELDIPTIGIGAGSKTDGQILVTNDMIGDLTGAGHVLAALTQPGAEQTGSKGESALTPPPPKFVRKFTSVGAQRIAAVQEYEKAVRERRFPNDDAEAYKIKGDEWKAFLDLVGTTK